MLSASVPNLKRTQEASASNDSNSTTMTSVYKAIKQRSYQHPRGFGRTVKIPARFILPMFKSPSSMVYQFLFPDNEFCTPFYVDFCHGAQGGNILAVGDEDGRVSLLRTDKDNEITNIDYHHTFHCHKHAITDIKWSRDDTMLVTAATDRLVRLWDVEVKTSLAEFSGHTEPVKSVNWHPYNEHLLVTGSKDGSYRVWDTRFNQKRVEDPTNVDVIPIYRPIKSVPGAHKLPLPRGGSRKVGPKPLLIRSVTCALFLDSDEEKVISSGSADGSIKLWDIRAGRSPQVLQTTVFSTQNGKLHGITDMKLDSSGSRLFSSCMDNTIYMHYLTDLTKPAVKFSDPTFKIGSFDNRISLSPDDQFLLSGSFDKDLYVWEVDHPRAKAYRFEGHTHKATGVSWHKSSMFQFASCSEDFTTRIWTAEF